MENLNQNVVQPVRQLLSDKAWARWTALALVASMMLFAYMFVDVMSPLQSLVQTQRGWSPDAFGYYAGAEYILNVFGFLILAGIILDKMGVRFTGTLSASLMVIGASMPSATHSRTQPLTSGSVHGGPPCPAAPSLPLSAS